jgi:hypothetical protein
MVIGERFAWAHLPLTGGMATRAMFESFPELLTPARVEAAESHVPFRDREDALAGKLLALNFRRLPAWILSRAHRNARYPLEGVRKPDAIASPQQMSQSSLPDRLLGQFTDKGRIQIHTWLRMESLAEDFLVFVSQLTDVSEEQRRCVGEVGEVNSLDYDHEIGHWFTPERLRLLYQCNPNWSSLEKALYGNVMVDAI